jgi:hypothetical protein
MSRPAFARATPLSPPTVKRKMNPTANRVAGFDLSVAPPYLVASQLKILIPVGTAMMIVAAVKYARVSTSLPTVYLW